MRKVIIAKNPNRDTQVKLSFEVYNKVLGLHLGTRQIKLRYTLSNAIQVELYLKDLYYWNPEQCRDWGILPL